MQQTGRVGAHSCLARGRHAHVPLEALEAEHAAHDARVIGEEERADATQGHEVRGSKGSEMRHDGVQIRRSAVDDLELVIAPLEAGWETIFIYTSVWMDGWGAIPAQLQSRQRTKL